MKIHIMGASGSGTTTLGQALGRTLSLRHLDTDHYYWLPTHPPYQEKRPPSQRQALLLTDLNAETGVVVSGSLVGGDRKLKMHSTLSYFYICPPVFEWRGCINAKSLAMAKSIRLF